MCDNSGNANGVNNTSNVAGICNGIAGRKNYNPSQVFTHLRDSDPIERNISSDHYVQEAMGYADVTAGAAQSVASEDDSLASPSPSSGSPYEANDMASFMGDDQK